MKPVVWSNADNALQVHGGNGFALESRILNIFEGAAEIQVNIIAKGLISRAV